MRTVFGAVLLLLALSLPALAKARGPGPDPLLLALARDVADTWIETREPEGMAWNWAEGVVAFGLLELGEVTEDQRYVDYVRSHVEYHEGRGIDFFWNDDLTPATSAALLALRTDFLDGAALDGAVRYVFEDGVRTASGGLAHLGPLGFPFLGELWVDTLFHLVPLLVRLHELRGEPRILEEATDQMLLFARVLQDPDTGLFTHAWFDLPRDEPQPGFEERRFWARGNGWALAALADLLAALPCDHPARPELLEIARRLERAVRRSQSRDGRWHTLLLDESSYLETAGSALLTYGLARGARAGIFGPPSRVAARRGMVGLLGVLQDDGELLQVREISIGTLPTSDYAGVAVASQLPHGVGAWLLAATEFLRPDSRPMWRLPRSWRAPGRSRH